MNAMSLVIGLWKSSSKQHMVNFHGTVCNCLGNNFAKGNNSLMVLFYAISVWSMINQSNFNQ